MTNRNSTQQSTAIQAITFANADNLKMSSREIAELTNKRHDHVVRDILKMLNSLDLDAPDFGDIYFDTQGRKQAEYHLNPELTITLISGYSVKLRHAIVKRWMELEKQAVARIEGKQVRHLETDAIRDLVNYARTNGSKNADMYYMTITKMTNAALNIDAGQRDNLDAKKLDEIKIAETMVKMAISDGLNAGLDYKDIYKLCKDRVSNIAKVLLG